MANVAAYLDLESRMSPPRQGGADGDLLDSRSRFAMRRTAFAACTNCSGENGLGKIAVDRSRSVPRGVVPDAMMTCRAMRAEWRFLIRS